MTDKLKWDIDISMVRTDKNGEQICIADVVLGGSGGAILSRSSMQNEMTIKEAKRKALEIAIARLSTTIEEMNLELSKLQGV